MTTVVIAAYKAAWCLPECIASIVKQTKRPDKVLIGCDGCKETREAAMALKDEYRPRRGIARTQTLNIEPVWFPRNSGVYRVKNTLALLADPGSLVFFDADDVMYENHVEVMTKALNGSRFVVPRAECLQPDGTQVAEWTRAHGATSILRSAFVIQGGFEPWRCAADSEAVQRWQIGGLTKCVSQVATMLVRKHDKGLTQQAETGYNSKIRNQYREEIKRRMVWQYYRRDAIAIADFEDSDGVLHPIPTEHTYCEPEPEDTTRAEAEAVMGQLLEAYGRGINKKHRDAYDRAALWMQDGGGRGKQ